jgi:hypothetical protein
VPFGTVSPRDVLQTGVGGRPFAHGAATDKNMEAKYRQPKHLENVQRFRASGGDVIFMSAEDRDGDAQIWFTAQDLVMPICQVGQNRSQVMYLSLLQSLRNSGVPDNQIRLSCPHGSNLGYFPLWLPEPADLEDGSTDYPWIYNSPENISGKWDHTKLEFENAFGVPKRQRIGQELLTRVGVHDELFKAHARVIDFEGHVSDDEMIAQKSWLAYLRQVQYDLLSNMLFSPKNLLSQAGPGGRVIMFCFASAPYELIDTFLKVNQSQLSPATFANIVIVAIPWGDFANVQRDEMDVYKDAGAVSEADAYFMARIDAAIRFAGRCANIVRVVQNERSAGAGSGVLGGRRFGRARFL